ncbi:hypothetical protein HELRODRAFT_173310 [Helobdella robusta]|uniref:Uncharacterized protein n=1 Tax=Helobdella robusta TaxID=6412 RepID=T1F6N6_HELRO|nr:hypothetical protein HELRODRAFT_173310 [Helobdella robusta]ESO03617.1 hypothetical protein HELRODRAFT_173310 [Helobdella robusta]
MDRSVKIVTRSHKWVSEENNNNKIINNNNINNNNQKSIAIKRTNNINNNTNNNNNPNNNNNFNNNNYFNNINNNPNSSISNRKHSRSPNNYKLIPTLTFKPRISPATTTTKTTTTTTATIKQQQQTTLTDIHTLPTTKSYTNVWMTVSTNSTATTLFKYIRNDSHHQYNKLRHLNSSKSTKLDRNLSKINVLEAKNEDFITLELTSANVLKISWPTNFNNKNNDNNNINNNNNNINNNNNYNNNEDYHQDYQNPAKNSAKNPGYRNLKQFSQDQKYKIYLPKNSGSGFEMGSTESHGSGSHGSVVSQEVSGYVYILLKDEADSGLDCGRINKTLSLKNDCLIRRYEIKFNEKKPVHICSYVFNISTSKYEPDTGSTSKTHEKLRTFGRYTSVNEVLFQLLQTPNFADRMNLVEETVVTFEDRQPVNIFNCSWLDHHNRAGDLDLSRVNTFTFSHFGDFLNVTCHLGGKPKVELVENSADDDDDDDDCDVIRIITSP